MFSYSIAKLCVNNNDLLRATEAKNRGNCNLLITAEQCASLGILSLLNIELKSTNNENLK